MNTVPISRVIANESYKVRIGTFLIQYGPLPVLKWIKKRINNFYDKCLHSANTSLAQIPDYTIEKAQQELKPLRKFLLILVKYTAKLESINFFDDPALNEKAELTLDKLYALEAELKILAFSNKKKLPTSPDLINAITEKSKVAVAIALGKKRNEGISKADR